MSQLSSRCPACGEMPSRKVLYAALPARVCIDPSCLHFWGPGAVVARLVGFDGGELCTYGRSYLAGVWAWLLCTVGLDREAAE